MEKRVAVTGLGVLSCVGNDVRTFWDNLIHGVCGIDYITEYPTDNLAVKIGGMVRNFNPEEYIGFSNKVSNECIVWFIIDFFWSTNLLDFAIVHNDNCVRHG